MLLDGEINGKGAADLVRLFIEVTNSDAKDFPVSETTIQFKRLEGGITQIEMSCEDASAAMSFSASDWTQSLKLTSFNHQADPSLRRSSEKFAEKEEQRPYRNLAALIERACVW